MPAQTADTRTEFGLRSDKSCAMQGTMLTPRVRAHDYDPNLAVITLFQSLPGASFIVNGARTDDNSALANTSAGIKWLNSFWLAATLQA